MINMYSLYGILKVAESDPSLREKCDMIEKAAGMTFEEAVLTEKNAQTKLALVGLMVIKNASVVLDIFSEIEKCACEGFYDGLIKTAQVQTQTKTQWWQEPGQPPPAAAPWLGASGWLQNKLSKMYGGGTKGDLLAMGSTIPLYFMPGFGTVVSGLDAIADVGNIFRRGATWTQRLGSAASALANTGWAALGLIPGLSGLAGVKALKGAGKPAGYFARMVMKSPTLTKVVQPVARWARRVGKSSVGKYLSGTTKWQKNMKTFGNAGSWMNPARLGARFISSPSWNMQVGIMGGGMLAGNDPNAMSSKVVGLNLPTATKGVQAVQ